MIDQRKKNVNWTVADAQGNMPTWERIGISVLMDLRDELQEANRLHRQILDGINTIRHFFHQKNMRVAIAEVLRREAVKARRHATRQKAARAKAKAKAKLGAVSNVSNTARLDG